MDTHSGINEHDHARFLIVDEGAAFLDDLAIHQIRRSWRHEPRRTAERPVAPPPRELGRVLLTCELGTQRGCVVR